ncbi:putative secondary metabolism biosynthetic enzyme [Paecilomyces lecythidis]|uniref:Secondary metabolism biosynthetic enzyme n=1 Tax=Paecilomyces lecythidis TaxID=3004212 RepID=A0ABR3XWI2_9EURO
MTSFLFPSTQTAIISVDEAGSLKITDNVPVIDLEPDAVLIHTAALALNPVDTKMLHGFACPGAILGFDFAGTIVAVGSAVMRPLKPGDRVCGSADGMNRNRPSGGAFAEYTSCPASLVVRIPADMPFTDAAGLGTSLASAGLALFRSLQIPGSLERPADRPIYVLINGGSTGTGTMAIQLLRRCNLRPIVTCSPEHVELVTSYGAEKAFDYHSPTCAQDIRAYTRNALSFAVDCITQPSTMKLCYDAIGRAGGRYVALDPFPESENTRRVVKPDWILATSVTGQGCSWPTPYGRDGDPKIRAWAEGFFAEVQQLIEAGQIRSHPVRVSPGGLSGIFDGIEAIRRKEVRGFKLVYPIEW